MNLTQSLTSSLVLVSHRKGLEKAEAYLIMYEKAVNKAQRQRNMAKDFHELSYAMGKQWEDKALRAEAAAGRLAQAYHNIIGEIYQTPLLCNR